MKPVSKAVEKPLPKETTFGEIESFRAWRLKAGFLQSTYVNNIWHPKVPMEAAVVKDHMQFGVFSWKNADLVVAYVTSDLDSGQTIIFGKIKSWGKVIECEKGYRSEYAKIVSLDSLYAPGTHLNNNLLEELRKKYL